MFTEGKMSLDKIMWDEVSRNGCGVVSDKIKMKKEVKVELELVLELKVFNSRNARGNKNKCITKDRSDKVILNFSKQSFDKIFY